MGRSGSTHTRDENYINNFSQILKKVIVRAKIGIMSQNQVPWSAPADRVINIRHDLKGRNLLHYQSD
jgi:hypothetical protein